MPEKGINDLGRPLREQFEKGQAAIHRNNLDYAVSLLSALLAQEPAFYPGREALRDAQLRKAGNRGGFLKRMLGTASNSPLLAKAQIELRSNPRQAIETAEQILNSDPRSVAAHKILAEAATALDLPKTAVLSLHMAFNQSPDRALALRLGEALAQAGQDARAESVLSDLARTFPNDPEIAQVLKNVAAQRTLSEGGYDSLEDGTGSYRDILRNKDEAVALEQAQRTVRSDEVNAKQLQEHEAQLAQSPHDLRLLRSAAELYAQQRQYDRALACFKKITDAEGVPEASLEQAITRTLLQRFDDQIAALNPDAPDYPELLHRLQAERAQCEFDRVKKLSDQYPNDLSFHFDLGEVCFRQDRLTEAIQEFQKAQNNPHRRVQALYYLGLCFERRGILDLAARTFLNALREKVLFDDEKKQLIYALGCVLDKQGKRTEAMEQFKLIYEIDIGYKDVAARVEAFYASGQQ